MPFPATTCTVLHLFCNHSDASAPKMFTFLFDLDQAPGTTAGTEVLPGIVVTRREIQTVDDAGESHRERRHPAKTAQRGQQSSKCRSGASATVSCSGQVVTSMGERTSQYFR